MSQLLTTMILVVLAVGLTEPPKLYPLPIPIIRLTSKFVVPPKLSWTSSTQLIVSFAENRPNHSEQIYTYSASFNSSRFGLVTVVSKTIILSTTTPLALPVRLIGREEFQHADLVSDAAGRHLLIETDALGKPVGPQINLGSEDPTHDPQRDPTRQVWLARLPDGRNLRPLLYSKGTFAYAWSPKANYIIAYGLCYGSGLARGIYAVELANLQIVQLSPEYRGHCESGARFEVSPNEKTIVLPDAIVSMDGRWSAEVCSAGSSARSSSWSRDGQYLFLACEGPQSDRLERYDTARQSRVILSDGNALQFRATRLAVSPDLKRIAFQYGTQTFGIDDTNGIWVIDFT